MSKNSFFILLRATWKVIPHHFRHGIMKIIRPIGWYIYGKVRCARGIRISPNPSIAGPLVIAGLFETANGIGEAARLTFQALKTTGLSPIAVNLSDHFPANRTATHIPLSAMPTSKSGTLILQLNAPETVFALHHLKMYRDRNWRIIGYWAWELSSFPKYWDQTFPYLSEIWAISDFTAKSLSLHPKSPPIHTINHPVLDRQKTEANRSRFGFDQNEFIFISMADSLSSIQRKNPFSTITAFKQAFQNDQRIKLVIKTRNLKTGSKAHSDLRVAIGDAPNIRLFTEELSDEDRWALLHSVDALVSLHRAEGYGLPMAEAMSIGLPVIATNWSGNVDFMNKNNSLLVDFKLISVDDPYKVYTDKSSYWAEPKIDDAAAKMLELVTDTHLRSELSKKSKASIYATHSMKETGAKLRSILQSGVLDK